MNAEAHKGRAMLPDIGDALSGKFQALHDDTSAERCCYLLAALESARTHVNRLRIELERGETPTV